MAQRTDSYQARARELAVSAGLDPDSRVGDGRGMPLWCGIMAQTPQLNLHGRPTYETGG